jgi:hypothetical protein
VTRRDIRIALQSATRATPRKGGRWRLDGGWDDEGVELSVVIVLTGRCLVVTVF